MKIHSINNAFRTQGFSGNEKKYGQNQELRYGLPSDELIKSGRFGELERSLETAVAKQKFQAAIQDPIIRNLMKKKNQEAEPQASLLARKLNAAQKQRKGFSKRELDMEKIRSITLPESKKYEMRSFENSDKKFILDRYQKEAAEEFINGNTVIVDAPTGTGKTLIAEYGIDDALKKGEKILYLAPLKALSNEKFAKFSELFGQYDDQGNFLNSDNIGIVTGDVSINPNANFLIMTTEIYRNLVNSGSEEEIAKVLEDFTGVIYDEFHYLQDPDRGKVWEESVMHTPKHMRQMMLSATASNAKDIAQWIEKLNPQKPVRLIHVPENERYVPLKEYIFGYDPHSGYDIQQVFYPQIDVESLHGNLSDRQKETVDELEKLFEGKNYIDILKETSAYKDGLVDCDIFAKSLEDKGLSKDKALQIAYILSDKSQSTENKIDLHYALNNPPMPPLIRILDKEDKLPALVFIFSKKKCKNTLDDTSKQLGTLLKPEESKRVLDIVNEAKDKDIYLGKDFEEEYLPQLLQGYAVHHAGMLPAYKSLVERLAREGLVKVCFATETLLAGINMPFRTTVFSSLEKFDGRNRIIIPPTTYKQGAGRAGRRGKDDIGNVIACPTSFEELAKFKKLMKSSDTNINSTYGTQYASLLQDSMLNRLNENLDNSFYAFQNGTVKNVKIDAHRKMQYLKERGFVTQDENGMYELSEKGEIAKNVYGINQVLFTELIDDPKYTAYLEPEDLVALMTVFADIKDDRARTTFEDEESELAEKITPAIELAQEITTEQIQNRINEPIKMSTNLVPAMLEFANAPSDDPKECVKTWRRIYKELRSSNIILHEGDLLRVVNSTIDLLKTVIDTTDDSDLALRANKAIDMLTKPPVTDILNYELDIK